ICSLVPGKPGLSENIKVKSIIGLYLEHSRIYYFYNSGEEEVYLSSADWMMRNLDRRVEILFHVKSRDSIKFLIQILKIQLEDNFNSWELDNEGNYNIV